MRKIKKRVSRKVDDKVNKSYQNWLSILIGIFGLVIAIIAAIPDFLALDKDAPQLYYSKSTYQVILPEGIDKNKVLDLLSKNQVPHGKLELQIINKGEGPSSTIKIRIQTNAKIKYLTTIPPKNDKVAWVEIGKNEIFALDSTMIATQELNSFPVGKPFIFQTWFVFDSLQNRAKLNLNENIQLYYDGKPAIEIADIKAAPELTLLSRFEVPLKILLGTFFLTLIIALVSKVIIDPVFRINLFVSLLQSIPIAGTLISIYTSDLANSLADWIKRKDKHSKDEN